MTGLAAGCLPSPVSGAQTPACEWCGSTIGLAKRPGARFCSSWCRRRAWGAAHGRPIVAGMCVGCGTVLTGRRSDARWCSERCRMRARREAGAGA